MTVGAVVVTHDRPALLETYLDAIMRQVPALTLIIVVDNASGPETATVLARFPEVLIVRLEVDVGGAGGFATGIMAALGQNMDWLWLMDDDGRPQRSDCPARLRVTAGCYGAGIVGPFVLDMSDPRRLAFPIPRRGRPNFLAADIRKPVLGFAHLFNGAMIRARLFRRIELPDPRFFIRDDDVEFMRRAKHGTESTMIDHAAPLLHPRYTRSSAASSTP